MQNRQNGSTGSNSGSSFDSFLQLKPVSFNGFGEFRESVRLFGKLEHRSGLLNRHKGSFHPAG